ncbi:WGR domain-containing protein [Humisphaera borealis]|uniref:WGR domain-containing protein n=1 Tax=Humisphaera borealis TaxID=2807512 RepID=UPI0036F28326
MRTDGKTNGGVVPSGPAATTSGKAAATKSSTVVQVGRALPAGETEPGTNGPSSKTGESGSNVAPPAFRRFEYNDEKSSKFWEVGRSGCDVTTKWGRIGSAGQSKSKTFANEDAAKKQAEKLIEEKTGEGYDEV